MQPALPPDFLAVLTEYIDSGQVNYELLRDLNSRANALVRAGAAVNVPGARAVLAATTNLIVYGKRTSHNPSQRTAGSELPLISYSPRDGVYRRELPRHIHGRFLAAHAIIARIHPYQHHKPFRYTCYHASSPYGLV